MVTAGIRGKNKAVVGVFSGSGVQYEVGTGLTSLFVGGSCSSARQALYFDLFTKKHFAEFRWDPVP